MFLNCLSSAILLYSSSLNNKMIHICNNKATLIKLKLIVSMLCPVQPKKESSGESKLILSVKNFAPCKSCSAWCDCRTDWREAPAPKQGPSPSNGSWAKDRVWACEKAIHCIGDVFPGRQSLVSMNDSVKQNSGWCQNPVKFVLSFIIIAWNNMFLFYLF